MFFWLNITLIFFGVFFSLGKISGLIRKIVYPNYSLIIDGLNRLYVNPQTGRLVEGDSAINPIVNAIEKIKNKKFSKKIIAILPFKHGGFLSTDRGSVHMVFLVLEGENEPDTDKPIGDCTVEDIRGYIKKQLSEKTTWVGVALIFWAILFQVIERYPILLSIEFYESF